MCIRDRLPPTTLALLRLPLRQVNLMLVSRSRFATRRLPDVGFACVFVVAQLLREKLAKDLAMGNHEPLARKLTNTLCHRKYLLHCCCRELPRLLSDELRDLVRCLVLKLC